MGGLGTLGGTNYFYMGTQNRSKLEIWPDRFLIHTLQLKLRPFEVTPYVCIGSHVFAMFSTWGAGPRAHINVTTITHSGQNWCTGCVLALYGSTTHPAQLCVGFRTIFFLLSVLVSLKKMPKIIYFPNTFDNSRNTHNLAILVDKAF